ncbi:MAG TPA: glycine oxidase ThiO [Rhizomicrobium sp.]
MKIVIIGAGVAGLATGWRLAQSGADVTVLERAQPGRGATWASAGMIAPVGEGGGDGPDVEFGRWSAGLWPDFAAQIEEQSRTSIGYRRSGALLVARDNAEAVELAACAAGDQELELLNGPQALAMEPMLSPMISGALWASGEAQVDSRALGTALARAFVRAGGTLQLNEAVVRMEVVNDRVVGARTPFALYEADAFVLAAGAWTSRIEGIPEHAVPTIAPVKGEMIAFAAPPGSAMPSHVIWGNKVYLVPRRRRVLVGATVAEAGYDTSLTDEASDWLAAHAVDLMPTLKDWQVDEHWAGLRPSSRDGLPLLGPTRLGRLFLASGQFRNGILFAPAVAEVMRRTILEGGLPPEFAAFDPRRFLA